MKRINSLIFTWEEFDIICDRVFNGEASIKTESDEWFWVMSENILCEAEIEHKLNLELSKAISGFGLEKIYVDITEGIIIVTYK